MLQIESLVVKKKKQCKKERQLYYTILFKKEWQNEVFQKLTFFEMFPHSKQDIRTPRKKFWKISNIVANIEYFAFNCCNLTFSQIEIIIKFLKKFVKESLNSSQTALCEGFSYHKCEILWLLSCIAQTSTKNKNKNNLWNIWNRIYWHIISSSK